MSTNLADQLAALIADFDAARDPQYDGDRMAEFVSDHSEAILSALRAVQFAQMPATIQELESINRRLEGDDA